MRFGGVAQAAEQHREARGLPALDVLLQDLRYTFRTLRRDRGFASVAVLILALGIGANIAVFSVVNTILLRPLPFRDPQQLVWMASDRGVGGLSAVTYTVAAYEEFLRHNRSFQDVTGYDPYFGDTDYKLTGRGEPQQIAGVAVAGNFFPLLGVQACLGTPVHSGGVPERRPGRGAAGSLLLAAAVCRGPRHRRAGDHAERPAGDGRRRASGIVRFRFRLRAWLEDGYLSSRPSWMSCAMKGTRWH